MGKILYFDCLGGLSGDMTLGALLDLGVEKDIFIGELDKLNVEGFSLDINKKRKDGISATDVYVHIDENLVYPKRNLNDIINIIDESLISQRAKEIGKSIFILVAESEARVHGQPVEDIFFHEIGALDSIVDIMGASICIDLLDVDKVYASPIHLGTGFIECANGIIPIPAPATVEVLKDVPIYQTNIKTELVTPTGAAIIKTIAENFISMPKMTIKRVGYGSGKKNLPIKNLLRVIIGEEVVN
ncbi:hypothetical protein SH1V18_23810 [Vallitalea longa]|uniref:TIGR00299 family protein n=1 Tax=Vallitalea longa TaxID=2936439 RepID=A0A9W5YC13_9FIRM|nr:LarC family nickel insertion protein [Vallitalea longa]GKX29901.1 hypothetical protein SH1V18_23810 [Vallitalea longa]